MPRRPSGPPVGVQLAATAKTISAAFDDALAAAGGTRPVWLVLMALRQDPAASQQRIAERIGIRGATLTHHLNAMEQRGLVTRTRETGDRRVQVVSLTEAGERLFEALRATAQSFDRRLRAGIPAHEVATFQRVLTVLAANMDDAPRRPPRP